jgi:8-oxo-dGTP pyrophosphatase MutT (NUDIX family)
MQVGRGKESIDIDNLRSALYPAPVRTAFVQDDGVEDEGLTSASVLFPIVMRGTPSVLLTQRTDHLRDHPGQISFPGGRVEAEDASPAHTALREAQEEIGLASAHVEVIGYLPEYRTITGYRVTPVVALVTPPFELLPDPHEVAEIFEVPFAFLMDVANHQEHSLLFRGKLRRYLAMPYGKYYIWGATAGIIATLSRALEARGA